jgi:prephenate dehydratase
MTKKIAYQGQPGAYSDLACRKARPDYTPLSCSSFTQAMEAVISGEAEFAMIPVDNSLAGRVADIHRLLPEKGLRIIGEHFQPIRHCLVGLPGTKIEDITQIFSHVHALPQCEKLIKQTGATPVVYGDTALSAKHVAEKGDKTRAAISSSVAAELYGLEILREDVQDDDHNTTRFIILSRQMTVPEYEPDGKYITSLLFRLRSMPAVLYKCLGGFATNGINLTKLESYMVDGDFEAVQFYCDIEVHIDDPRMQFVLEEVDFYTERVEIFGTYPAHKYRFIG